MMIHGLVADGKFTNLSHLLKTIRGFDGQQITIDVVPRKTSWTNQQRKYLFAGVYPFIADMLGCNDEEARSAMKGLYLFHRKGILKMLRSEKDLTMEEYEQYLTRLDMFCIDQFGVNIPEPKK